MKKYTGLLSLEEVAEILGITNDEVLGFIDAGLLRSFRVQEKHFIQAEGVNRLINPDFEEENAPKEKKERPEGKPDKDGWVCVREGIYRKQVGKGYEYKVRVAQKVKGKRKETTRKKDYDGNKFTTLREAENFRNRLIVDLTTKPTKQQYHTVQEVYEEVKKNRFSKISSGTISKHNGNVSCHIVPYFNETPIEKITVGELKNLIESKNSELKYQTLKGLYGTLKKIWAYAYEMKYISKDAYYEAFVDDVTKIKITNNGEEKRNVEVYTQKQMDLFFEEAKKEDPVFLMAVQIFAYTGMRQAEALALRWRDINFDTGYITVKEQLKYDKLEHRRYFAPTKTKDTREFMAPPVLLSLLKDFKVKQEENEKKLGLGYRRYENYGGTIGTDLVLRYEDGKHVTSSNMCKFRERMQKRTGLHFTFHSIRHTLVTEIHGAGVPLKTVSEFIGHKDMNVTKIFYIGSSEKGNKKLKNVVKKMR